MTTTGELRHSHRHLQHQQQRQPQRKCLAAGVNHRAAEAKAPLLGALGAVHLETALHFLGVGAQLQAKRQMALSQEDDLHCRKVSQPVALHLSDLLVTQEHRHTVYHSNSCKQRLRPVVMLALPQMQPLAIQRGY